MSTFLGICIAVLLLAVAFVFATSGIEMAAVSNVLRAQAPPRQAAWLLIAVSLAGLIACTIWQNHLLVRQHKVTRALERRFGDIRSVVDELSDSQKQSDHALQHLMRTDPEDAVNALAQQVAEAERRTLLQQGRNEASDLESRIESIRQRQQALRERVGSVVANRQSIDEVFTELNHRQYLVERTLSDIEKKDNTDELETRIQGLVDFAKMTHFRFDEIERLLNRIIEIKTEFDGLQTRLSPLESQKGLVQTLAQQLTEIRDQLLASVDNLERDGERKLAERVQEFADSKQQLEQRVSSVSEQFEKLDVVRKDIGTLLANLNGSLGGDRAA